MMLRVFLRSSSGYHLPHDYVVAICKERPDVHMQASLDKLDEVEWSTEIEKEHLADFLAWLCKRFHSPIIYNERDDGFAELEIYDGYRE